jgi:hypothetical protein
MLRQCAARTTKQCAAQCCAVLTHSRVELRADQKHAVLTVCDVYRHTVCATHSRTTVGHVHEPHSVHIGTAAAVYNCSAELFTECSYTVHCAQSTAIAVLHYSILYYTTLYYTIYVASILYYATANLFFSSFKALL